MCPLWRPARADANRLGRLRVARDGEAGHPAEAEVVTHPRSVGRELVPQRSVRGPRNRLVAVEPALTESDPHQGPLRGVGPAALAPFDQRTAHLEREPGRILK